MNFIGKRGHMRRERACIEGDDKKPCEGESEDERLCPNHCPSSKKKNTILIFFRVNECFKKKS